MKSFEILALQKAVSKKEYDEASSETAPGTYRVRFVVEVDGVVKKGEDYGQDVVQAAKPWLLFATAMNHLNGVTVESIVREALEGKVEDEELKAKVEDAMVAIKGRTRQIVRGKVTTKVRARKIEE